MHSVCCIICCIICCILYYYNTRYKAFIRVKHYIVVLFKLKQCLFVHCSTETVLICLYFVIVSTESCSIVRLVYVLIFETDGLLTVKTDAL